MSKQCSICGKPFESIYPQKNVCSWVCRQEKVRTASRYLMRKKRHNPKRWEPCVVCGYKETTDIHHEGAKTYILCPNHHALITRSIKTIKELLV